MWKKFEVWSKKHAHLLVFFGALVVFLTFVVKEGIGEHFRAVADAIDRARELYSIRTEIRSASEDLRFELGNNGLKAKRMSDARDTLQMMGALEIAGYADCTASSSRCNAFKEAQPRQGWVTGPLGLPWHIYSIIP
jgi:hypothetical protein